MGQKIHPIGFRLARAYATGASRWYANSKNFPGMLHRGHQGSRFPEEEAGARGGRQASSSSVRPRTHASPIYSARPGVVIGKKGEDIESLRARAAASCMGVPVHVNIEEVRKPELDAQLIADSSPRSWRSASCSAAR